MTKDIQGWFKYAPNDAQYAHFPPATIASAYKINDVYNTFTMGRWNLSFYDYEDYGDIVPDNNPDAMKLVRSMFIYNSLSYFNYSIDLSWQMIWYYYHTNTFGLISNEDVYNEIAKGCDLEGLNQLLDCQASLKCSEGAIASNVKRIINEYWNDPIVMELRQKYNYLKHRGSFQIRGLGINPKYGVYTVNGNKIPLITRKEIDLDKMKNLLYKFDDLFVDYFNKIISSLIPNDYLTTTGISVKDMINYYLNNSEEITK